MLLADWSDFLLVRRTNESSAPPSSLSWCLIICQEVAVSGEFLNPGSSGCDRIIWRNGGISNHSSGSTPSHQSFPTSHRAYLCQGLVSPLQNKQSISRHIKILLQLLRLRLRLAGWQDACNDKPGGVRAVLPHVGIIINLPILRHHHYSLLPNPARVCPGSLITDWLEFLH